MRQVRRNQGRGREAIGQLLGKKSSLELLMLWPVFFFVGIVLIFLFWRPKKNRGGWVEMTPEEKYLLAKRLFSRDPASFKDKDNDGVEDIIDK